jgi:predicted permease
MKRRLFHLGMFGPRVEEGVSWEIEHHLEERIDELVSQGMTRAEAEQEARKTFGDMERVRSELIHLDRARDRKVRVGHTMEAVWQVVRFAGRAMRRNVGFTLAVVLTLGLGIGANSAMFSVVDALLLRPLPYAHPNELMENVVKSSPDEDGMPYLQWDFAREWQEKATFASSVLLHQRSNALYIGGTEAVTLGVEGVSPEFVRTIGIAPAMGRGITADDARPGAPDVVIISHGFWKTQLASDPNVIGRTIALGGKSTPFTVIGVMPKGFKFPEYSETAFWMPLHSDGTLFGRKQQMVYGLARIAEDRLASAEAQARTMSSSLFKAKDPASRQFIGFKSVQSSRASNRDIRQAMWMLSGAVVLILLVAGFNMINLLLVRSAARTRELAVRMAIGASRIRVIRQLMTEAFVMALLSGVVAVLLALLALQAMDTIMPESITFFSPYRIGMGVRGLFFTFIVACLSGLAFGMIPAFMAVRRNSPATDAGLTNYGGRGRAGTRLRRALVVLETAMSVTLMIGAFLLIHSFVRLMRVDPGFDTRDLAILKLTISSSRHGDAAERAMYLERLKARIGAIPGVTGSTIAAGLPPSVNLSFGVELAPEGAPAPLANQPMIVPNAEVQPEFFDIMGVRVIAGRAFDRNDAGTSNVILDEDMARYLWPDGSALGKRFHLQQRDSALTVVGVVRNLKMMGPAGKEGDFSMLYPLSREAGGFLSMAVKTKGDVKALLPEIRRAVREVDSGQPIESIVSGTDAYLESVDMPRFLLAVMTALGGTALILAALGLYGVLAFGVAQRSQEMAVRIALGARPFHVRAIVIEEGLLLAAAGVVIGAGGALVLSKLIASALYEVRPAEPGSYVLVAVTMLAVALIACWVPARRATRIAPSMAMRVQ